MPKIKLRHGPTGQVSEFEPVDAREILATPNTEYEVDEDSVLKVGAQYGNGVNAIMSAMGAEREGNPDARTMVVGVPQLMGGDEDLQTGLSVEKYGRAAVNKAQPQESSTAATPMTTTNRPLSLKDARKGTNPAEFGQQPFIEEGGPLDNSGKAMAERGGSVALGAGPAASYQTAPETGATGSVKQAKSAEAKQPAQKAEGSK